MTFSYQLENKMVLQRIFCAESHAFQNGSRHAVNFLRKAGVKLD